MQSLGMRVGNKEIAAMIEKYDADLDGSLNYSEFVKIMMQKWKSLLILLKYTSCALHSKVF